MAKKLKVRRLAGTIKRNCLNPTCGKEFEAKNAKGVYCSAECRGRHFYHLKKDANVKPEKKKSFPVQRAEAKTKPSSKRSGTMTIITTPKPVPAKVQSNLNYLQQRQKLKTTGKKE